SQKSKRTSRSAGSASRRRSARWWRSLRSATAALSPAMSYRLPAAGHKQVWWLVDRALLSICSLPELFHRGADLRIEPAAAGVEMREDLRAHPRVPELLQMVGDAGDGLRLALARKELADLIGHVDQPVRRPRRHALSPPA